MKPQTVEEWLKAGNVITKSATKKAKGYKVITKMKAAGFMNTKSESHAWWPENKQNDLLK